MPGGKRSHRARRRITRKNAEEKPVPEASPRKKAGAVNGPWKGIVLAGGNGTRLYPITTAVCKQLLPVYNKPLVYYPLSVLMLAGIRDILVITTTRDRELFRSLLGDGAQWGIRLSYEVQPEPGGIAQALLIGRTFIGGANTALILGDNIFYGHGLTELLRKAAVPKPGATIFGYSVRDPERYGVVELDGGKRVVSITEKPIRPRSPYAVTGLYFYDSQASEIAAGLSPSNRGELEITDVNREYLRRGQLRIELLGRGFAWLDTGTHESLLEAATFIETLEKRQGQQVACLEEIAFTQGWIGRDQVRKLAEPFMKNAYGRYLLRVIGEE
jgi:glucose-1-phosphate thymidylyltransferase